MNLEPIPAFEDNYIWAVHDGHYALLVDPGESAPILSWLERLRMKPAAILITHHHNDHCGGLGDILRHYRAPVFGPERERIGGVDHPVREGTPCRIPELDLDFEVMDIPGHTPGHVAYIGHGWLFCGDTLFSCGCGKVFGSTAERLHASLTRLARLPPETLICCAHEYTLENIRFALTIDPANEALRDWQRQALALRERDRPTLPVRLVDELARNPFLRCSRKEIQARIAALCHLPVMPDEQDTFVAIRGAKDHFK
jgi:hydroxyacylglutathione hydrolase